jgi:surfactin synthase thioesterase subunit
MQAVQNVASVFPGSSIWLAGHSLGAGLAILTGRNMVKKGALLDSFLFNPPFAAAPIERISDERVKHGFRIARSFITAGLTIAMKGKAEGNNQRSIDAVSVC